MHIVAVKTTGLKPEHHEVIEVSIKPFGHSEITYRMRPEKPETYSDEAQKANGVSVAVATQFPPKEEVIPRLLEAFSDITALGHFFKFDYGFLAATCGAEFVEKMFGMNKATDIAVLIERINLKCMERGEKKMFPSAALKKLATQLEIPWTTKCEVIEAVYKRIENGN